MAQDGRKKRKREEATAQGADQQAKKSKAESDSDATVNGIHPDRAKAIENAKAFDAESMQKHTTVFSKFKKSLQRAATQPKPQEEEEEEPKELHGLEPIPQPASEPTPEYRPTFSTLPQWLQEPVTVPSDKRAAFTDLGVGEKTTKHLHEKGFTEAFAVQCALIPRLMYLVKTPYARPNDVCVSAPTGSGKTLGYALPIVEGLRSSQGIRRLRAVVVVPTRELVDQAVTTFRKCMAGSALKIGTSVGNQSFAEEQNALVERKSKLDPAGYERNMKKALKSQRFEYDSDDEDDEDVSTAKKERLMNDTLSVPTNHVPIYNSAVDILVCTPGRLVEHLENTAGFTLDHLDWLVIDEADRLLDQSFQDWVRHINKALDIEIEDPLQEQYIPTFYKKTKRYVRKVILSATMTRDISQLEALKLRRPTMIVVRTEGANGAVQGEEAVETNDKGEYELPAGLTEAAISVGDGSEKPLYLIQLLSEVFKAQAVTNGDAMDVDSDSSSDSSSDSDSDSDSDSSDSDSDSDSDSSSDSGSSSSSASDTDSSSESDDDSSSSASSEASSVAAAKPDTTAGTSSASSVLVFAASTAEAHRLHHLLTSLLPSLLSPVPPLVLLTKSHSSLSHSSKARIIISTDRASRGLDLPLGHVINYTIPRSLESYVHRVGRTARAGRDGQAWSLVRDVEARWYWNEVGRAAKVRRATKVERKKVALGKTFKEGEGKEKYRAVLEEMSKMVGK